MKRVIGTGIQDFEKLKMNHGFYVEQIADQHYETDLIAKGISAQNILKYGFAFQGKECLIRKQ